MKVKSGNPNMDLELDLDTELNSYEQRWDIDGTGVQDGVDPKLR